MTKLSKLAILGTLASSCLLTQPVAAFEFHGYVRSGTGGNSEGGDQVCFSMPGAGAPGKFRLGNECEHYSELTFSQEVYKDEEDGSYFKLHVRQAFIANFNEDFESFTETNDDGNDIASREFFVDGGNLVGGIFEGANFWIGKRFYRRHDVHITDFYFWDMSGVGGGIENIGLGDAGKLHYAYFRNTIEDDLLNPAFDQAVARHDFRFSDIQTNPGGNLTVGLDYRSWSESRSNFDPEDGFMLTLLHFQDNPFGWGGFNKLALQYGRGAAASLASWSLNTDESYDSTWRLTEMLLFEPTSNLSGMFTITYEDSDWDGRINPNDNRDQYWLEVGGRIKYHFTNHIALAVEVGREQVNPDGGDKRTLDKITIAPLLTTGRGFFSRPELRLFATYANWNNAADDAGISAATGNVFDGDTDGFTYGLQAEAWW